LAVSTAAILVMLTLSKVQLMEVIIEIILGLLQVVLEPLFVFVFYRTGLIFVYLLSCGHIKKSVDEQSLYTLNFIRTNRFLGLYYRNGETYILKKSAIDIGFLFWFILIIVITIWLVSAGSA